MVPAIWKGSCGPGVWAASVKSASTFLLPVCADQTARSCEDSTHAVVGSWEVSVVARTPEGCVTILRSLKPHLIEAIETASGPTGRSLLSLEKTQGRGLVWPIACMVWQNIWTLWFVSPSEGQRCQLDHLGGSASEGLSEPHNMATPLSRCRHARGYGCGSSPLCCHC